MFHTTHRALTLLLLAMSLSLSLAGCSTSKSEAPDEAPAKAGAVESAAEEETPSADAPEESGEKTEERALEKKPAMDIEEDDGGAPSPDEPSAVEAKEQPEDAKKDGDAPDSNARTTGGESMGDAPDLSGKKSRKRSAPATKGKSKKCPPDDKDCEEDPGYLRKRPSKL